ncbi:MAG TPA: hypothetical protein VLC46_05285 [Thermoanaerobaculia bacterium]|jgi:hypothetical protein|nr:hypothetical protein [Thermoanaerobaculia bacterium]
MKKTALVILALALALPLSAETWKSVSIMDSSCSAKKDMADNPDAHTRSCALKCAKSGYGAMVDGKFVKFDAKGNAMASKALSKSDKTDHLRATVTGDLKDGVINVSALSLD